MTTETPATDAVLACPHSSDASVIEHLTNHARALEMAWRDLNAKHASEKKDIFQHINKEIMAITGIEERAPYSTITPCFDHKVVACEVCKPEDWLCGAQHSKESQRPVSAVCAQDFLHDDRFTGAFIEHAAEGWLHSDGRKLSEDDHQLILNFAVGLVEDLLGEPFKTFCAEAMKPGDIEPRPASAIGRGERISAEPVACRGCEGRERELCPDKNFCHEVKAL